MMYKFRCLIIVFIGFFSNVLLPSKKNSENNNLNILYIVGPFPVLSETFLVGQIIGLIKKGHNVTIYATQGKRNAKVNINVQRYNLMERLCCNIPSNLHEYDIIFCSFGQLGNIGLDLRKKSNCKGKVVACFHGTEISQLVREKPHLYDNLLSGGDLFLPISEYFRQRLIDLGGNPQKIIVHHMGVDCSKFSYKKRGFKKNNKIRILTVNRLVEKKGTEYAIRAMAHVLKKHSNIEYIIIGDGPRKQALQQLINRLGISSSIKLLGNKLHHEVLDILHKSHIFLLASVTSQKGNQEGIPVSIMEAMATGIPVVSTLHSGIPELVQNGVSGFLVPERDVDALAHKLNYLIEHPEIWESMGLAGRKIVEEHFNVDTLNDKLVCLLEKLANS